TEWLLKPNVESAGRVHSACGFASSGRMLTPSRESGFGSPARSQSVGYMLRYSTVASQRLPGLMTPGVHQISGARVASSHSVAFPKNSFSPRCQPCSLSNPTIELFLYGLSSNALRTKPICASTYATDARYACTTCFHADSPPAFITLTQSSVCPQFLPAGGRSMRSFAICGGSWIESRG